MTKKLLMGNEAFAHAALEAGVRVVAGYPGTPSSEVIETVAKLHAQGAAEGVHVEWSTNEKAALELLAGASLCGARCLFTCKQVGLNVASDALLSLNYVGVNGGLVLFVADDPGPISSQTEQDTRRFAAFAKVPVLDPATPEQGFLMMKQAFELSERYCTPVIVRPTTRICHSSAFFEVQDHTCARAVPEGGFLRDSKWVIFPRRAYQGHGEVNERLRLIARDFACDARYDAFNALHEGGDGALGEAPFLGIAASGASAMYAREALSLLEKRCRDCGKTLPAYRFWQVGTPYPFPDDRAQDFVAGLREIAVFEDLDCVLEDALLQHAGKTHAGYEVKGKLSGFARDRGENTVEEIAASLEEWFGLTAPSAEETDEAAAGALPLAASSDACIQVPYQALDNLPMRPPVLCAGCPHRGSFYAVKRALGKQPAVFCGDIGCYTLGNALPLDAVDTCLCMGAGITMAQGFSVADPGKKALAFVGDSTFFASGLTGFANAHYNQHDITVFVLDNAITAMTGAQPHPGTGKTLMGKTSGPLDCDAALKALGCAKVLHADPLKLDQARAAAEEAIAFEGFSAVIFESPCVQLFRPKRALYVDASRCTGCRKCITEIGCPAIGFDKNLPGPKSAARGQAFVDANLCNGCDLCAQVCPFEAFCADGEGA